MSLHNRTAALREHQKHCVRTGTLSDPAQTKGHLVFLLGGNTGAKKVCYTLQYNTTLHYKEN